MIHVKPNKNTENVLQKIYLALRSLFIFASFSALFFFFLKIEYLKNETTVNMNNLAVHLILLKSTKMIKNIRT